MYYSPGDKATVEVGGLDILASGNYTFSVTFSDANGLVVPVQFFLSLTDNKPGAVSLMTPGNQAGNISPTPRLDWAELENTVSYSLEVASDAAFSNLILQKEELRETSYLVTTGLDLGGTFYWRVKATNPCGDGEWSPSNSFTVASAFNTCMDISSGDLPIVIDEEQEGTYNSVLNFPFGDEIDGQRIESIRVTNLKGTHTWLGDLTFKLTSPSGTTITLLQWECEDITTDFDIKFGDDAALEHSEVPCPYCDGKFYQPDEALSAFIGEFPKGDWTLEVDDFIGGDGGDLQAWSIEICPTVINSVKGEADAAIQNLIKVFPNPAQDKVSIKVDLQNQRGMPLEIFDLAGRLIKSDLLIDQITTVDVSHLAEGVYFFRIWVEGEGFVNNRIIIN